MDYLDDKQLAIVAKIDRCNELLERSQKDRKLWNIAAVAIGAFIGWLFWPSETWLFWLYVPAMVIVALGLWSLWLLIDYNGTSRVTAELVAAKEAYLERLGRIADYKREAAIDPHEASLLHAQDILRAAPECVEVEIVRGRVKTTYTDDSVDFWKPEWVLRNQNSLFRKGSDGVRFSAAQREHHLEHERERWEQLPERQRFRRGFKANPSQVGASRHDDPGPDFPRAITPQEAERRRDNLGELISDALTTEGKKES